LNKISLKSVVGTVTSGQALLILCKKCVRIIADMST